MTQQAVPSPFTETTGTARHAAFAELAARGPLQYVTLFTGVPVWLVTGYAETRELLAHPDVVRQSAAGPHSDSVFDQLIAAMDSHMLNANPPDHTRLRKLVSAAFTRRRIELLEPRIREIAAGLLDDLAAAGQPVDLVSGYGYPLPITVIAELIGIPTIRREDFRRWSSIVVNGSVHSAEVFVEAVAAMVDYIRELIEDKRVAPAEDLISDLIAVRSEGDRLSPDELTSMIFLLLAAGHETTVSLISNGVHSLLTHPDQLAALKADPELMPAAVEELLRYDGPLQVAIPYVAAKPVQVAGVTIGAGQVIVLALLAANRDPDRFDEPDQLDVSRAQNPHLAFGHGIHHCLGAPLARLEGRIALSMLFERFPDLRLATAGVDPSRTPGLLMNGVAELPVVVH